MVNDGQANGRYKDNRSKGHRLGWVSNELWQEMKAQAEAQGMTVSDYVIAAIEAALHPKMTLGMLTNYDKIITEMNWIENYERDTFLNIGVDKDPEALKWQALDKQRRELYAAIEAALVKDKESVNNGN